MLRIISATLSCFVPPFAPLPSKSSLHSRARNCHLLLACRTNPVVTNLLALTLHLQIFLLALTNLLAVPRALLRRAWGIQIQSPKVTASLRFVRALLRHCYGIVTASRCSVQARGKPKVHSALTNQRFVRIRKRCKQIATRFARRKRLKVHE